MCGRIVRVWDPKLEQWVVSSDAVWDDGDDGEVRRSRYNIAPVTPIMVAQLDAGASGRTRLKVARWGFDLPSGVVFNTRAEDAEASPLWRAMLDRPQHHAVAPATGFYEWTTRAGSRVPHFLRRRDGEPMLLAGLASVREAEGRPRLCMSVLTCAPRPEVAALHDRMPVYLEAAEARRWLDAAPGTFQALARTPRAPLDVWEVSPKVNKAAGVDGPELIAPVPRQARLG